jgi:hypothetical protein
MALSGRQRTTRDWAKALGAACLLVCGGAACALGAESEAVRRGQACALPSAVLAAPAKADTDADKAGAPPAEPPKGEEAGGGKGVIINAQSAAFEAWRLPENFKTSNGSFNEVSLIAQQKKRLDFMNEKLSAKFKLTETTHYLIFSDAAPNITSTFVKMSEALYANLRKQFAIGEGERIWDGKCILLLFGSRDVFLKYSKTFDGHDAASAGAYFAWECNDPKLPQLVHICIPTDKGSPRRLQELFAHEGTHAFFQLYKRPANKEPVMLPLWLHEGLAEYMTVVNDPQLKPKKQAWAIYFARTGADVHEVLDCPVGSGFKWPAYNVSYTLVDYLLSGVGWNVKFKKFVELLKADKGQDEALKEAYGFGIAELQERWRAYCRDVLPNSQ